MSEYEDYRPRMKEICDEVCRLVADGVSLRDIEGRENMPARETIRKWMREDEGFKLEYELARRSYADDAFDEALTMARQPATDMLGVANKKIYLDHLKWDLARRNNGLFGETVTNKVVGGDGGPIEIAEVKLTLVRPSDRRADTGEAGGSGEPSPV